MSLTAGLAVQYMAPEVLARQHYSEKADVYSFGIVLFECCSRQVHPSSQRTLTVDANSGR